VAARGKPHIVELAALTEGRIDKRVQGRRFVAIVDDGALAAAAHVGNVTIGDLVPLQGRTDELDADLVEKAILRLFDRLGRDIRKSHRGYMGRELLSDTGCHGSFSSI
jgi:hypothetical protein